MKRRFPVSSNYKASDVKDLENNQADEIINIENIENEGLISFGESQQLNPTPSQQNFLFDKSIGGRFGQSRLLTAKNTNPGNKLLKSKSLTRPDTLGSQQSTFQSLARNFFDAPNQH